MGTVNTVLEANQQWAGMSPDERAVVKAAYAQGADPIHATNLVMSKRMQGVEQTRASAEEDLRPRTAGENVSSFAQGLANTLGMGAINGPEIAKGVGTAILHPSTPIDSFVSGYKDQKQKQQEADDQAPAAAGGGHLAGDIINAALGLASPANSAATAAEDLAAGAKPAQVFSVASPAAKSVVKGIAQKVATVGDKAPALLRAALGVKTLGASEGALGLARALANLGIPTELAPGLTALEGAAPAAASAAEMPVDVMAAAAPAKAAAAVDPKAAETMAESLDPGGKDWKSWLLSEPAEPVARPDLDAAAKVMETKTGAGGVSAYKPEGIGTPTGANIGRDLVATENPEEFQSAMRSKALDSLKRADVPADMPADVAAGGEAAAPPRQIFQGDVASMADQVMKLPAEQRAPALQAIARLYNKKTALNVAKATGLSTKLVSL